MRVERAAYAAGVQRSLDYVCSVENDIFMVEILLLLTTRMVFMNNSSLFYSVLVNPAFQHETFIKLTPFLLNVALFNCHHICYFTSKDILRIITRNLPY